MENYNYGISLTGTESISPIAKKAEIALARLRAETRRQVTATGGVTKANRMYAKELTETTKKNVTGSGKNKVYTQTQKQLEKSLSNSLEATSKISKETTTYGKIGDTQNKRVRKQIESYRESNKTIAKSSQSQNQLQKTLSLTGAMHKKNTEQITAHGKAIKSHSENLESSGRQYTKHQSSIKHTNIANTKAIEGSKKQIAATKKVSAANQYMDKLLNTSNKSFQKWNKTQEAATVRANAATEIRKKGIKAIDSGLRTQLKTQTKVINQIQETGITGSAAYRQQSEAILKVNSAMKQHGASWGNLQKKMGKGLEFIHKAGMLFLTTLGPIFLVGAAMRTLQQVSDYLLGSFIKLEDALFELRKTAGISLKSMWEIGAELERLTMLMPLSAEELAKIAATAGRLGIRGKKNIIEFTKTVAMMATATDLSAEDAAQALGKLTAAFDIPIENVKYLGSVINELSNISASSASEIVEAMKRVGAAGKLMGFTAEEVAAMASTLIDMGHASERSGPFSKDTEILTKSGWKRFDKITLNEDIYVLDRDTNKLKLEKPLDIIVEDHTDKPMIHIKSKHIDLLTTPEHLLYVSTPYYNNWQSVHAEELLKWKRIKFKCSCDWDGEHPEFVVLPALTNKFKPVKEKQIPIEDYIFYIAMFIAEGNFRINPIKGDYVLDITQDDRNPAYLEIVKIHERLKQCGINYNISKIRKEKPHLKRFSLRSKQLYLNLQSIGFDKDKKSYDKIIPDFVKTLDRKLLRIFLESYALGDGSVRKDSYFTIYSSSKKIIDSLQELCLKAGYVGRISILSGWEFQNVAKAEYLSFTRPAYALYVQKKQSKIDPTIDSHHDFDESNPSVETIKNYKGNVYCVSVPSEIIYVRRNGKPVFAHNTRIRRMFTEMARKSHKMAKQMDIDAVEWSRSIEENPSKALEVYLGYLKDLKPIKRQTEAHEVFGKVGGFAAVSLAQNIKIYQEHLKVANREMMYGSSLIEEFGIAVGKTSAQLQILTSRTEVARRAMGEDLIPIVINAKKAWADFLMVLSGTTYGMEYMRKGTNLTNLSILKLNAGLELSDNDLNDLERGLNRFGSEMKYTNLLIKGGEMTIGEFQDAMQSMSHEELKSFQITKDLNSGMGALETRFLTINEAIYDYGGGIGAVTKALESEGLMTDDIEEGQEELFKSYNKTEKAKRYLTEVTDELNRLEKEEPENAEAIAGAQKEKADAIQYVDYVTKKATEHTLQFGKVIYDTSQTELAAKRISEKHLPTLKNFGIFHEDITNAILDENDARQVELKELAVEAAILSSNTDLWKKWASVVPKANVKTIRSMNDSAEAVDYFHEVLLEFGYTVEWVAGQPQIISDESITSVGESIEKMDELLDSTDALTYGIGDLIQIERERETILKVINNLQDTLIHGSMDYTSLVFDEVEAKKDIAELRRRAPPQVKNELALIDKEIAAINDLINADEHEEASKRKMALADRYAMKATELLTGSNVMSSKQQLNELDIIMRYIKLSDRSLKYDWEKVDAVAQMNAGYEVLGVSEEKAINKAVEATEVIDELADKLGLYPSKLEPVADLIEEAIAVPDIDTTGVDAIVVQINDILAGLELPEIDVELLKDVLKTVQETAETLPPTEIDIGLSPEYFLTAWENLKTEIEPLELKVKLIPELGIKEALGLKVEDTAQHGLPYVPKTGLYKIHEGETVLTKSRKEVAEIKSGNTYHFNFGGISLSPDYPAQRMMKDIEDYATSHII